MSKAKALQTPWYDKTVKALQLAGMGDRTQECYALAVRKLLAFHEKDPRRRTERISSLPPERVQLGAGHHADLLLRVEVFLHPRPRAKMAPVRISQGPEGKPFAQRAHPRRGAADPEPGPHLSQLRLYGHRLYLRTSAPISPFPAGLGHRRQADDDIPMRPTCWRRV